MTALGFPSKLTIVVFVVTSMFSVGLALSLSQIRESLRSARLIFSALFANFFLVPMFAYFIAKVMALDKPLAIGLLLLGTGAGAPLLPKLVEFARGNLAFSTGLMVLLMGITTVYMPIVVPILLPAAHVSSWKLAKPLLTATLTPMTLGLLVRARKESFARRLEPYVRRASTVALILAIIVVLAANYRAVSTVGWHGILAGGLLLLVSFSCGLVLGGRTAGTRSVLMFGTAQRSISAAFLVAAETFSDSAVLVMLIVVALMDVCIQIPIAIAVGRRRAVHCVT